MPGIGFDEFVRERLTGLLRYATVLTCDPDLAQDVVQEVLLRAQQRWDRIAPLDVPAAYVKRMVTNEYLSWRRRKAAREIAIGHSTVDMVVDDPASGIDERDAMLARIAALPPKQRAAVVLRYYDNRTDTEIAEVLGCRPGTVRSHLSHALAKLRTAAAAVPAREGR